MNEEKLQKIKSLLTDASSEIKEVVLSNEINKVVGDIGLKYKIQIDLLSNLIDITILTLLGEIKPESIVEEIEKQLSVTDVLAVLIVAELDKNIFQKVHFKIIKDELPIESEDTESESDIKEIVVGDTGKTDSLREQIKSETVTESAINKSPLNLYTPMQKNELTIGSHQQLMEQLQILETIPDNEDVEARLNDIKKKIEQINSSKEGGNTVKEEVREKIAESNGKTIIPETKAATYSKAPTKYNVDPYREVAEE